MSDRIHPPEMDWAQIMVDLYNAGCKTTRVARILDVWPSTAQHWTKGGEPGYGYGRALLRLHSAACGAALTTQRCAEAEETTKFRSLKTEVLA
jgi:hypothetical protein